MADSVQMPYAVNQYGRLVHIADVDSGLDCNCTCIDCGESVVARKGSVNAHHFAHAKDGESSCSGESVLHKTAKTLIASLIDQHIGGEIKCEWDCTKCGGTHAGNLVKDAARVDMERRVGSSVADIVMYDHEGHPTKVIEIVVTHEPTPASVQNYRDIGVSMLRVNLVSFDDLATLLGSDVIRFAECDLCRLPSCRTCGGLPVTRNMFYRWLKCSKCQEYTQIPFIQTVPYMAGSNARKWHSNILFADQFTVDELHVARGLRHNGITYISEIDCNTGTPYRYNALAYNCKNEECNVTFSNMAYWVILKDTHDSGRLSKWKHVHSKDECPSCTKRRDKSRLEDFSNWFRYHANRKPEATP